MSAASLSHAAVSCTLEHPDHDVKRLVPESTSYRVRDLIPIRHAKKGLMLELQKQLGSDLNAEFENESTPYTFYIVYKEREYVALIFGTNAAAVDGPMQIFVVYSPKGKIRDVFVQKMSSPDAPHFRSKYYREQFRKYTLATNIEEAFVKPPVRSPTKQTILDNQNFIRAVRLNILLVKNLYNQFKE